MKSAPIRGSHAARLWLSIQGFTPAQAERLITLRNRYLCGDFRELTEFEKHLRYGRWLIDHGRYSDYPDE